MSVSSEPRRGACPANLYVPNRAVSRLSDRLAIPYQDQRSTAEVRNALDVIACTLQAVNRPSFKCTGPKCDPSVGEFKAKGMVSFFFRHRLEGRLPNALLRLKDGARLYFYHSYAAGR